MKEPITEVTGVFEESPLMGMEADPETPTDRVITMPDEVPKLTISPRANNVKSNVKEFKSFLENDDEDIVRL